MMNKIVHIVMAMLLFVFTLGLNINIHYCAGKMVNVALSSAQQPCCNDGEVNCCNIVTERFDIDNYNLPSQINFQPEEITKNSLAVLENTTNASQIQTFVHGYFKKGNAPPWPKGVKTFLAIMQSYLL